MNETFVSLTIAAAASLTIAAALAATPASAQGTGHGPVARACAAEINQYCGHLSHGASAVRSCLRSHHKALSHECRWTLDHTGYGRRWR